MVVREGDLAPTLPAGSVFSSASVASLNDAGQMSIFASVTPPGTFARDAYWFADSGSMSPIAMEWSAAPHLALGSHLSDIRLAHSIRRPDGISGQRNRHAWKSESSVGIWVERNGSPQLEAITGQSLPARRCNLIRLFLRLISIAQATLRFVRTFKAQPGVQLAYGRMRAALCIRSPK